MITRFLISCRFIISGGRYTGRFAVRYREARYYYNEIRFSIGSLLVRYIRRLALPVDSALYRKVRLCCIFLAR